MGRVVEGSDTKWQLASTDESMVVMERLCSLLAVLDDELGERNE